MFFFVWKIKYPIVRTVKLLQWCSINDYLGNDRFVRCSITLNSQSIDLQIIRIDCHVYRKHRQNQFCYLLNIVKYIDFLLVAYSYACNLIQHQSIYLHWLCIYLKIMASLISNSYYVIRGKKIISKYSYNVTLSIDWYLKAISVLID